MTVPSRGSADAAAVPKPVRAVMPSDARASDARHIAARFLGSERTVLEGAAREPAHLMLVGGPEDGLDRLAAELALVEELEGRSLAANTRLSYAGHIEAWIRWCEDRGAEPVPAEPKQLATHLATYGVSTDRDGLPVRRDNGSLRKGVAPVTVDVRLAAIDKLHEFAGFPRPGADETVRRVVRGLRREFGTRPLNAREALTWDRLRRVVQSARGHRDLDVRRSALLLLRARTGATPGQLARLTWPDVAFDRDHVVVVLPSGRRGASPVEYVLRRSRVPGACVMSALGALAATTRSVNVFADAKGKPLTRQALHNQVVLAEAVRGPLTGWSERALAGHLAQTGAAEGGSVAGCRDAALLLTGWFAALRRSNLVALQWRDVTELAGGDIRLTLRFSKTDQEGAGEYVFLPRNTADPTMCPVTALALWRRQLVALLGIDPVVAWPTSPVFSPVDRHGNVVRDDQGRPAAMVGEAVNDLVARLACRAGLATEDRNPYGGHSLRVGFVTEAIRRGMTVPEIQEVTKHRDPRTVITYARAENTLSNNPARLLLARLAAAHTSASSA